MLGKSPVKPLRKRALRKAERWVLAHQDANGGWGGIQPAMLNSVMALHSLGYAPDHPAVAKGIQAMEDFLMESSGHLFFQPCVSPVWDTVWVIKALIDSGFPTDQPAITKAADWILDRQIFKTGDWQIKNPELEPGGWAFEFANDWYPDVDDSAVILFTLKQVTGLDERKKDHGIARGLNWILGMQSRNGGWGAFDTDNTLDLWNQMPFGDMKAMIDPPTADVTGRLLEMMGTFGYDRGFRRVHKALEFVQNVQETDGSWWGGFGLHPRYTRPRERPRRRRYDGRPSEDQRERGTACEELSSGQDPQRRTRRTRRSRQDQPRRSTAVLLRGRQPPRTGRGRHHDDRLRP